MCRVFLSLIKKREEKARDASRVLFQQLRLDWTWISPQDWHFCYDPSSSQAFPESWNHGMVLGRDLEAPPVSGIHLQATSSCGILTFGKGLVGIWDIGMNRGNCGIVWDGMDLKAHPEPSPFPGCSKPCPWTIPRVGNPNLPGKQDFAGWIWRSFPTFRIP